MNTIIIKIACNLIGGGKRNALSIRLLPLSNYQMCA